MATESNEIVTALRVAHATDYMRAFEYASKSVRELDAQQTRAERGARRLGERMDLLSNKIGRGMGRAATAGAAFGAGLVKMGLNFDAMIERAEIGNETLLGNAQAAKKMTNNVREFALQAPLFGVEQMMKTSQQLLGADYSRKSIIPTLTTFSDTLSALGRRPEDLQRLSYAFSQMMQKGQISAEELRGQLGEIFPAQKILARELGMSTQEFAKKMKEGTFKGKKYINLLLRGMEKDFGGATAKMAMTFDGQLANIRESAKYTLGILFKPLFYYLEKDAFPVLKIFGDDVVKTMTDASLTSEQKFQAIKGAADFWLGPIWQDFVDTLDDIDWGKEISDLMNAIMPPLMEGMGELGKRATLEFAKAWLASDAWGKLFGALFIAKLIGFKTVFGAIGKAAGKIMGKKAAEEAATKMGSSGQMTLFGNAGSKAGSRWGRAFKASLKGLGLLGFMISVAELHDWAVKEGHYKESTPKQRKAARGMKLYDQSKVKGVPGGREGKGQTEVSKFWSWLKREVQKKPEGPTRRRRQWGGPVSAHTPYTVGERGPELFVPNMSGSIKPSLGAMTLHNYVMLDGRVAAQSVAKHNFNEMARR